MDSNIPGRIFFVALAFLFIFNVMGASVAVGDRPPWAQNKKDKDKDKDPPVIAPEPSALSLIAVAAFAVIGYRLGKRLSGLRPRAPEGNPDDIESKSNAFLPGSRTGPDRSKT